MRVMRDHKYDGETSSTETVISRPTFGGKVVPSGRTAPSRSEA